eukprot:TRINITY_DN5921_c0_g2_i1.p1 TRINITY_DN5921_c0_g2~~TRINITY_DN5921_c0_g2_i1.p1  ORF type:complete len:685 (-),score=51.86 TRINITY_DN5921_c0_g2_i1:24-1967(-)
MDPWPEESIARKPYLWPVCNSRGDGIRQVWTKNCAGPGCNANGVNKDCSWCVHDEFVCRVAKGRWCREVVIARNAENVTCHADPIVTVPGLGMLEGVMSERHSVVSMFLGIPYAKPQTQDRRWRAPEPHGPWSEKIREAKKFGSVCIGADSTLPRDAMSEDCLFLNIGTPFREPGSPGNSLLPVLVWIHGGSYNTGSSNIYPVDSLVAASNFSVIVVTLNYRLNVFGFLGSARLRDRSEDGSTGNYGIQDQRLAIQWVRSNAAAFGGDGARVTIFGQSAGGNSVLNHLVQPASFGLYERAIVQSGTYEASYSLKDADLIFDAIVANTNCGTDLNCVLGLDPFELYNASSTGAVLKLRGVAHWGPVIDGVALVGSPQELIKQGKHNTNVPVVIGSVRDEWSAFIVGNSPPLPKYPPNMTEQQLNRLLSFVGERNVDAVKRLYSPSVYPYPGNLGTYNQAWWTAMRVGTDGGIKGTIGYPGGIALGHCSARSVAGHMLRAGTPAVFMYLFAHASISSPSEGVPGGLLVPHSAELPYVFGDVPAPSVRSSIESSVVDSSSGEADLARLIPTYWSKFAMSSDPNGGGSSGAVGAHLLEWPHYESGSQLVLRLEATRTAANLTVDEGPRRNECDFWDKFNNWNDRDPREILV